MKIGGFNTPKLETVPPGRNEWPSRGCAARNILIASSLLNSIRFRLVILNEREEIRTIRKETIEACFLNMDEAIIL